jgi:hypothetical protein
MPNVPQHLLLRICRPTASIPSDWDNAAFNRVVSANNRLSFVFNPGVPYFNEEMTTIPDAAMNALYHICIVW